MDIERALVQNLIRLGYNDLPKRVIEITKMSVLEQIGAKFRDCASLAPVPMPRERVEGVIETIENLEQLGDVNELTRLLVL